MTASDCAATNPGPRGELERGGQVMEKLTPRSVHTIA